MRYAIFILFSTFVAFSLCSAITMHDACADSGSAIEAGSGSSVGSAAAPSASSQLHNPTTDPAKAIADVAADWKSGGWPLGVLAGMFMLLELLAYAGTKYSSTRLAWFGKGRVSTVIAGGTAVAAAMIDKLAAGGAWAAVVSAAIAAGLLYYHPAGTDPAKA